MYNWEKEFSSIRLIALAIYSTVFVYFALIYFRLIEVPYAWDQTQQVIFYALLAMVPPVFIASIFVGRLTINPEKLMDKFHEIGGGDKGLSAAVGQVRIGALIMAAMGEACALYGLVIYFLTGDTSRPLIFFVLSILHYPVTMTKVTRARETIEKLARGMST